MVDRALALDGAVGDALREGAVAVVEILGGPDDRAVRVGTVLEHTAHHAVGGLPSRRCQLNPSEELLVAHAALALGLHLLGDQLTVLETRAPDRDPAPVQGRPGADMGRERPDPAPGVDRVQRSRCRSSAIRN